MNLGQDALTLGNKLVMPSRMSKFLQIIICHNFYYRFLPKIVCLGLLAKFCT